MPPYLEFIMTTERAILERTLPTILKCYNRLRNPDTTASDILDDVFKQILDSVERSLPAMVAWSNSRCDKDTKAGDILYINHWILWFILIHQGLQVEAKSQKATVVYDAKMLEKYTDPKLGRIKDKNELWSAHTRYLIVLELIESGTPFDPLDTVYNLIEASNPRKGAIRTLRLQSKGSLLNSELSLHRNFSNSLHPSISIIPLGQE